MHSTAEQRPTTDEMRATRRSFPPSLVVTTPLECHERLSQEHGVPVFLKGEDRQTVRSYKVRGAAAKMLSLTEEELRRGIVCASAGNHAQGVAACCNMLERPGTVFMPRTTPLQKIEATQRRGNGHVDIRLEGDAFDETAQNALSFAGEHAATYIHPFDDWKVIEGQGSVALEIAEQVERQRLKLAAVIVPVGGGGLMAGTVLALRETHPDTLIVGVEPAGAACMAAAVAEGHPVTLPAVDAFVDGAAVARAGERPFAVVAEAIRAGRARLLTVSNNRLSASMADLLQMDGRVTEPAVALSVAALDAVASRTRDGVVTCVVSGGNLDMRRMPKILQHAELHRRTTVFLQVTLPDRPGALQEMLATAADVLPRVNICYMRFDDDEGNGGSPPLTVGFQSKEGKPEDITLLVDTLKNARFHIRELSCKPAG
ncbi:MAG: pyridoxal-phosphate dependent enzyme [Candidatus Peribacteraceae bacterium]|nr:pyridoxal-phosphate dependent enzyme [Candidatus Peribacteraceae bacterium]